METSDSSNDEIVYKSCQGAVKTENFDDQFEMSEDADTNENLKLEDYKYESEYELDDLHHMVDIKEEQQHETEIDFTREVKPNDIIKKPCKVDLGTIKLHLPSACRTKSATKVVRGGVLVNARWSSKRKFLSLKDKAVVIENLTNGITVTTLAKRYGVAKATICAIKKKKKEILDTVNNTFMGKRKTLRRSNLPQMEKKLYAWFVKNREDNIPISSEILREQAMKLNREYREMDGHQFIASNGWLQKFKNRYGIRLVRIYDKKLSEKLDPFKDKLLKRVLVHEDRNLLDKTLEFLNEVNPKVICESEDVQNWNEGRPNEEELDEELNNKSDSNEASRSIPKISAEDAVSMFNGAIQWAEENYVNDTDLTVLRNLRDKALQDSLNITHQPAHLETNMAEGNADVWGMTNDEATMDEVIQKQVPKNTVNGRNSRRRAFEAFCKSKNYAITRATPVKEIARILKDYAFNMCKQDGSEFKETTVKSHWNSTAHDLQTKFNEEYGLKLDIFNGVEFAEARKARDCKRKTLQNDPGKRVETSAAFTIEEHTKMVRAYDESNPEGLARKFFLVASKELAWRGNEAVRALTTYFVEEKRYDGTSTGRLRYNPGFSKTHQSGKPMAVDKWLIPNPLKDMCPVRLFKKMISKRPNDAPPRLFLNTNPHWMTSPNSWYTKSPVGKNALGSWTKQAAEKIGLKGKKYTNHSARSTAVTHLASSNIPDDQLILITGHASTKSLKPYIKMQPSRHSEIINAIRPSKDNIETGPNTDEEEVMQPTTEEEEEEEDEEMIHTNMEEEVIQPETKKEEVIQPNIKEEEVIPPDMEEEDEVIRPSMRFTTTKKRVQEYNNINILSQLNNENPPPLLFMNCTFNNCTFK